VVKLWKRCQPLDQAKEVYRGAETDATPAGARTLHDGDGHQVTLVRRSRSFFESEVSLLTPDGAKRIALPDKSAIRGLLHGQIIVSLDQDWKPEGGAENFVQGSVISLALGAVKADSLHLTPSVVFTPTATEFAQNVAITKNRLLLTTLENVQGRVYTYNLDTNGTWTRKKLDVPDNQAVSIESANWSDDRFFLSLQGFLTPPSLSLGDAAAGTLKQVKTTPARFDASADVVEQLVAVSKDGTKVPDFVVRR
jgi:prolyl oligopeptidase